MKKVCGTSKGFTLIELLVVVAIIGTLAAILVPAIIGAHRTAVVAKARQEMSDIRGAVLQYFDEYDRMPVPATQRHGNGDICFGHGGNGNSQVLDILLNLSGNGDPDVNVKNITFLTLEARSLKNYNEALQLNDPWGNPYEIYLDLDFDDRITSVGDVSELRTKVGVYSKGIDGKADTKDDLQTW